MKRLHIASLALLLAGAAWVAATYPKIGHLTFAAGARAEALVYGLREKTVDIGELRMVTYQGGPADAKEAIVMLHGYSADRQVWPRFARHLLDNYRVIIPDLAGHGDTGFQTDWDYSAPAQAKRVAALLDKLGIAKAHIVGNSMGGFIAAHFALAYPERTLTVALIDPDGVKSPNPSPRDRMVAEGHNPFEIHSRAEFDTFYGMTMSQPPYLPGFVLAAMAEQYQARRAELTRISDDFFRKNMLDGQLGSIRAPALLLWGREDRVIDVSGAAVWAAGLPHEQLVILEGIGHLPMVEQPAESAELYRQFLASVRQEN